MLTNLKKLKVNLHITVKAREGWGEKGKGIIILSRKNANKSLGFKGSFSHPLDHPTLLYNHGLVWCSNAIKMGNDLLQNKFKAMVIQKATYTKRKRREKCLQSFK